MTNNPELKNKQDAALDCIEKTFAEMVNQGLIIKDAIPWEEIETIRAALSLPAIETGAVAKAVEELKTLSLEMRRTRHVKFSDRLDCIVEAIRSCEGGWQDISTAPKTSMFEKIIVISMKAPKPQMAMVGWPMRLRDREHFTTLDEKFHEPTHWQPLPAAPTHGEKKPL